MIIRSYEAADDPALMTIEYRSPRGSTSPFVHYRRRFCDRAAIFPDHQLFVSEHDRVIIGCIAIAIKQVQISGQFFVVGYLFDLRVDPDYRRQGLGGTLIQFAEDYLIQRGAVGAYGDIVSVNLPSLKLFENYGYQRIRQLLYLEYLPVTHGRPEVTVEYDQADDQIRFTATADHDFFVNSLVETVQDYDYVRCFHDSELGYAGLSTFDQSRLYRQIALDDICLPDELLRQQSRSLRLFDVIGAEQPALLQAVFDSLRDQALLNGYYSLTAVVDAEDTLPGFFFAEAEKQKRYWMVFKSFYQDFDPRWSSPFYIDPREI